VVLTPIPHDEAQAAAAVAEQHLERGEPLFAYNATQTGLLQSPGNARLRQLRALALARSGDVEGANRILGALAREGMDDAETLGMLARTHKDLALLAHDAARRGAHLEAGFALYERAYRATQRSDAAAASYTGINCATMAVLLGDLDRARAIASEVREICRRLDAERYWKEATLGEAALILGDAAAAAAHYRNAASIAGGRYGDVSTTRRQARLLAAHLPGAPGDAAQVLEIPPIVVFTGHMIDHPDRAFPRFPHSLEGAVRDAMRERLAAIAPLAVYSSAACGADILCLELARERGGETHVVLPFPPEEFRDASIDFAGGEWASRFDRVLAHADSVTITSDHRARDSAATFEYASLVMTGMSRLRSEMLDTSVRGLAVWDPNAPGRAGGSAATVAMWKQQGLAIEQVSLAQLRDEPPATSPAAPAQAHDSVPTGARHEIRSMLFADAVGYSKLSEDQVSSFVAEFLAAVAQLNRRTSHRCEHVETSGDGLYMVFASALDAGHYALELSALANGFNWEAAGLPSSFNLRIALHAGPVHCGVDPVTGKPLFTGPHTSRAARIEPITPPGQVYASSAFAAVVAAAGGGLAMRYVGRTPLAKGYGALALYHVRARQSRKPAL
jgi:hypothetical protein